MNRLVRGGCVGLLAIAALGSAAAGQTPLTTAFTYQGELANGGTPAVGVYDLRFSLFDAAAGGTQIGSTVCADNVSVAGGRFTQPLDFGAVFAGQQRFLEIQVRADTGLDCGNTAGFVTLTPRQPLTGAPNALFALNSGAASNATQLNGQGPSFYQNAMNLTAGTIPDARLSGAYTGALTLSNAGNAFTGLFIGGGAGLTGLNASNLAIGTVADARLSANVALLNNAQTFSAGKTFSAAPSFTAAGAPFNVSSTTLVTNLNADRLNGLNSTAFLQGIPNPLTLSGPSATWIMRGENTAAADGASGVIGIATGASGVTRGVLGESDSPSGRGVFGLATAASGFNYGGYFQSNSTTGQGAVGYASAASGLTTTYGLVGQSDSTLGRGVFGWATSASGLTNYGVYGESDSGGGWSVWAQGRLGASGTKSFRIDHPDDPENKYLLHYSTESPEVINFYRGTVVLGASGGAAVELPSYFGKINKTPSYQLTAVGAPMPMLHVAEEIDESALDAGARAGPGEAAPMCSFRIAGGAPGGKVCWRVEALRNDRWVQQHGAPVEVEKQGPEKGTYQHPELYGQPPEKGMNYEATRGRDARPPIDATAPMTR